MADHNDGESARFAAGRTLIGDTWLTFSHCAPFETLGFTGAALFDCVQPPLTSIRIRLACVR